MPNLLLVGATNNGKTMIVEKFKRGYPRLDPAPGSDGIANISVVKMQMPPAPDERRSREEELGGVRTDGFGAERGFRPARRGEVP